MKKGMALALCGVLLAAFGLSAQSNDKEEKEVLATLQALMDSFSKKDSATAARIYHDALSYGHHSGNLQTKTAAVQDVKDGRLVDVKLLEDPAPTVTVDGQVALIRSIMDYGKDCTKPAQACAIRVLWVFVKGPQGWQVIGRQAVQSFGQRFGIKEVGTKPVME